MSEPSPGAVTPAESAWEAWYEPEHDIARGMATSPYGKMRAAFAAGWQALADRLGDRHYVIFTPDRWTVEHSVECRLSGEMHCCAWHEAVVRISEDFTPAMEGRWLIKEIGSEGLPLLERVEGTDG
jgi:hypothetical protein